MRLNFDPLLPAQTSPLESGPLKAKPLESRDRPRTRDRHVPAALRNLPPEPELLVEELAGESSICPEAEPIVQEEDPGEREGNVLQFPRSALNPVFCEELAEPVQLKPRILDVPEDLELAAAPLVDIGLAPLHDPAQEALKLELPLPVASIERRGLASLVDLLIVLSSGALFLGLLTRWGIQFPETKLGIALEVMTVALFWVIYEYLFLVYSGGTPGMQVTQTELVAMESEPVSRSPAMACPGNGVLVFPAGPGSSLGLV